MQKNSGQQELYGGELPHVLVVEAHSVATASSQGPESQPLDPMQGLVLVDSAGLRSVQDLEPVPKVVADFAMQHPQANRHIVLEQRAVAYVLQRSRRRTVGMKISPQGLVVAAPQWVTLAEIERILHSKAAWIVRKLREQVQQASTQPQIIWQNGVCLPWQGGLLQVTLSASAQQGQALRPAYLRQQIDAAQLLAGSHSVDGANFIHATLAIDLPCNLSGAVLRDCVRYWMRKQADTLFTQRLNHYAPQLGVSCSGLKLSDAKNLWGSATSKGIVRLHWRLVQMPLELLDYVVVHELAHLHEMNHSVRFWSWVEKVLPDYQQRVFRLKKTCLPAW